MKHSILAFLMLLVVLPTALQAQDVENIRPNMKQGMPPMAPTEPASPETKEASGSGPATIIFAISALIAVLTAVCYPSNRNS